MGDALEATVASALRRCMKRLGVGLELWDKSFSRSFMEEHVAQVWVKDRDGKPAQAVPTQGRPAISGTKMRSSAGSGPTKQRGAPATHKPPAHHDPHGEETITDAQVKRLWTIIRRRQRTEAEVKSWLALAYKIESTHAIKRKGLRQRVHGHRAHGQTSGAGRGLASSTVEMDRRAGK